MPTQVSYRNSLIVAFLLCAFAIAPAAADVSHVRIVRLSAVQGDVRFAQDVKGDSLTANGAGWQTAMMNLPIRQGYVLATDNGRAAVEFENGAMAFLAENTVLEFYDLSLVDGARTTRLILRQGSAEFTVHPVRGEYFSVTGGDFSVQAEGGTIFRLNNFDDGSNVQVFQGRITVLAKDKETPLERGQSLSVRAGDPGSASIARIAAHDEFDKWVSGKIQAEVTATSAALSNTYYGGYASGFGDLYTYGAWLPLAGYGSCWMPYGVGLGWSPFNYGSWYLDPALGWTFVGSQPWGWLPYHYGGWISAPGYGWCWSPGLNYANYGGWNYRNRQRWRPVNAVWVHAGTLTGLVLSHPMDAKRKAPLNLSRGVFPVTARGVSNQVMAASENKWKVENKPPRDLLASGMRPAAAPMPVATSMFAENAGAIVTGRGSTNERVGFMYDSASHRFVNTDAMMRSRGGRGNVSGTARAGENGQVPAVLGRGDASRNNSLARARESFANAPTPGRAAVPPRPSFAPPPVPRATMMQRPNSGGGSGWGGSSGRSSGGFSPRESVPASPAPRASAPAPSTGRPH